MVNTWRKNETTAITIDKAGWIKLRIKAKMIENHLITIFFFDVLYVCVYLVIIIIACMNEPNENKIIVAC